MQFTQNPKVAYRIISGVAYCITTQDSKIHTLTESGTLIWDLCRKKRSVADLCQELQNRYEVDPAVLLQDVTEFTYKMSEKGLLIQFDEQEKP